MRLVPQIKYVDGKPPDWQRFFGVDLFTLTHVELREAVHRQLAADWREVLGSEMWEALKKDTPADVRRCLSPEMQPYGLPLAYSPLALIYNRRIFHEAGVPEPGLHWSEGEFVEACETIRDHKSEHRIIPMICELTGHTHWPFLIYREGARLWSEDGLHCLLDQESALRGIRWLKEMILDRKILRPHISSEQWMDYSLFVRGRVAMQEAGLLIAHILENEDVEEWGVVALPDGRARATPLTDSCLAVSPHARDPDLVVEFIRFLRRPEIQVLQFKRWPMILGSQEGTNAALAQLTGPRLEAAKRFVQLMSDAVPLQYPASRDAAALLRDLMRHVCIDLEHAEEHCREACREINQLPELRRLRDGIPL